MEMPTCFVCGKKMRRNRKKVNGIYKKKFYGLASDPPRSFCSKRHLNKYFKNEKKYEKRREIQKDEDMMNEKEIKFTVIPRFTKGEKKVCICCPKEHISSYKYVLEKEDIDMPKKHDHILDMQIYYFIRKKMNEKEGEEYKQKKFKITIKLIE